MQSVGLGMRLAFAKIEHAPFECCRAAGIIEEVLRLAGRKTRKLCQEFPATSPHGSGKLGLEVGEEQERR